MILASVERLWSDEFVTGAVRIVKNCLTIWSPNYVCEFQQSGPNYFHRKSLIFKVKKQSLGNRSLGKTDIKQCKITCRLELDIGPDTAESYVEYNSTLDR